MAGGKYVSVHIPATGKKRGRPRGSTKKKAATVTISAKPAKRSYKSGLVTGFNPVPYMPYKKIIKMPYDMEFITLSSGFIYNTFRSNSCHDPDWSGGGHQPRGWDQIKTFYKYYRVLSCMAYARFSWDRDADNSHVVGIYVDQDSSFDFNNSADLYERNGFRTTKLLTGDKARVVWCKQYVPINKMTVNGLSVDRIPTDSNPVNAAPYIHVFTCPNNVTTPTAYVRVHVKLIYKVIVFEPVDVGGS